jgi:hypothetical protein
MRKLLYFAFSILMLIVIINLVLGIFFWLWNKNKVTMEATYVDAPYIYYNQKDAISGFKIDKEVPFKKEQNEIRIMIIGGSVAYGMGNFPADTNIKYIESQLKKIFPFKKITVLNGALPSYVSQQEFIAFQMVLSKYNPDLVMGIHGFNDIESFRLNHHIDNLAYIPSPIFYVGDEFSPALTAVKEYKKEYTFAGITKGYIKYIQKGGHFLIRSFNLGGYPYDNISDLSNEKLDLYATAYKKICQDLSDYCSVNFLQPVKFYNRNDSSYQNHSHQKIKPISPWLTKLYYKMEQQTDSLSYNFSLTDLDKTQLAMSDDCHPNPSGYKYLIDEVIKKITPTLTLLKN